MFEDADPLKSEPDRLLDIIAGRMPGPVRAESGVDMTIPVEPKRHAREFITGRGLSLPSGNLQGFG